MKRLKYETENSKCITPCTFFKDLHIGIDCLDCPAFKCWDSYDKTVDCNGEYIFSGKTLAEMITWKHAYSASKKPKDYGKVIADLRDQITTKNKEIIRLKNIISKKQKQS